MDRLPSPLRRALALLGALALAAPLAAQAPRAAGARPSAEGRERPAAPSADPGLPRNALYLEFGGAAGDRLSVNYERAVWREARVTFLARAGLFYLRPRSAAPDGTAAGPRQDAGDMILGVSTVYDAASHHRIETGLGLNVRWHRPPGDRHVLSHALPSATLGYRRLPRDGRGLMWRANLMLIHGASYNWLEYAIEGEKTPAKVMPWAGVSIGYAF
jgi:hypothetical protein